MTALLIVCYLNFMPYKMSHSFILQCGKVLHKLCYSITPKFYLYLLLVAACLVVSGRGALQIIPTLLGGVFWGLRASGIRHFREAPREESDVMDLGVHACIPRSVLSEFCIEPARSPAYAA